MDSQGRVTVVYWKTDGLTAQILARRQSGSFIWYPNHVISGKASTSVVALPYPDVAVDSHGTVTAVWSMRNTKTKAQWVVSRTVAANGNWGPQTIVSLSGVKSSSPQVAVDPQGDIVETWLAKSSGQQVVQAISKPNGGPWGAVQTLSSAQHSAAEPRATCNANGDCAIAWRYDLSSTYSEIQAKIRPHGSTGWGKTSRVSTKNMDSGLVDVAAVGTGAFAMAWSQTDGSNYLINLSETPVAGASWSPATPLSAPGMSAYGAKIAVDPAGDVSVMWQRGDGKTNPYQIQTATLPQGTTTWPSPSTLSNPSYDAESPQIATDAAGDLIAGWVQTDGTNYQSWASVSPASGGGWGTPQALSASGQDANSPDLAASAEGNFMLLWSRNNGTYDRIQSARYDLAPPVTYTTQPTVAWAKTTDIPVGWRADDWTGISGIDLQVNTAPWNGSFGGNTPWTPSSGLTNPTTYTGQPGGTYCFSARATDSLNNVGLWSTQKCATTPVDDVTGVTQGAWSRVSESGVYQGTLSVSKQAGATLTFPHAVMKDLRIITEDRLDGGHFAVYFNGKKLKVIDTASSAVNKWRMYGVKTGLTKATTGKLVIKVIGDGTVRIDGLWIQP